VEKGSGGALTEGPQRVLFPITDRLPGFPETIRRVSPQAEGERYVVHGVRWILG